MVFGGKAIFTPRDLSDAFSGSGGNHGHRGWKHLEPAGDEWIVEKGDSSRSLVAEMEMILKTYVNPSN